MTWIAIKLFLGGAMKRLLSGLTALLGIARQHPWQTALAIALCALAWTWRGWSREEAAHLADNAKHKAELARIEQASAANLAAQIAQVKAVEAKSAAIAKDNANAETQIRTVYVDRGRANAERMRFDKVCSSAASGPAQDNPAPVDHGPGPEAIVLERRDYDILIENTARLEAVHQWGDTMVKEGLAIPEVGF
jgi:hypothetical protein